MKVLALSAPKGTDKHYIVEAGSSELKMILGNYYDDRKIEIGTTIKVNAMYDKYKAISANKKKLGEIKVGINAINKSIEKIEPIIAPHAEETT